MKRQTALVVLLLAVGLAGCNGSTVSVEGLPMPTEPGSPPVQSVAAASGLHGLWALQSLQESAGPVVTAPGQERFTAEFRTDGRIHARADCNRCSAVYEAGDGTLALNGLMACTRAYCQSSPLDTTYAKLLGEVATWRVEEATLELRSDAGTLRFRR
jgi:heat shock protein HslJ